MRKLTKKLLITTGGILGLLSIGVGTSIALSSCTNKENQDKIDVLNNIKNKLNDQKIFAIKSLKELDKNIDILKYKEDVSDKLFKWLNTDQSFNNLIDKKINPNKLITQLVYNDLKLKVVNKEKLQKIFNDQVEPLIKDISYPINHELSLDTTIEVRDKLNNLIDLYINLYKSL